MARNIILKTRERKNGLYLYYKINVLPEEWPETIGVNSKSKTVNYAGCDGKQIILFSSTQRVIIMTNASTQMQKRETVLCLLCSQVAY